jgi:hypothetical protein
LTAHACIACSAGTPRRTAFCLTLLTKYPLQVVSGLHVALLSGGDGGYLGMMSDDALRRQLAAKRDRVAKLREAEKTLQGVAFA